MRAATPISTNLPHHASTALELDFPIVEISRVSEQESWRKEINRPLYHIHKWWAIRLGTIFRAITLAALSKPGTEIWSELYSKHNLGGRVVLDPFMGSGTTLGEATKLGAKAIGCDINPISTFMVRQAFTHVPETKLRDAFSRLKTEVAAEIGQYFCTEDPQTAETIPVLYFFWVKTVNTPDGHCLPLFSRYVFAQDAYPKKRPDAQILCPNCWGITQGRYDARSLECPHCLQIFDPQQGPVTRQHVITPEGNRYRIKDLISLQEGPPQHRLYALLALRSNGEKVYLPARARDHELYVRAQKELRQEDLPLPTLAVRPGHNTDQARGYGFRYWSELFNDRQLLCLGLLLRAILRIEDPVVQEQMLCLFSSTLEFNNMFCSFKGEGTGAVRHAFSHHILKPERTPLENSVWGTEKSSGTFSTLFESRLLKAKQYLDRPFELFVQPKLFGNGGKGTKGRRK